MNISSDFSIAAQPTRVFEVLLDPDTMRACIPGCESLERTDDTHYKGVLTNEVAHVKFNARFVAELVELERPRRIKAVMSGEDRRLGSSMKVTIALTIDGSDNTSQVNYDMDIALWGKMGRLGESIVRRKSIEVEREFASALTKACGAVPAPVVHEISHDAAIAKGIPIDPAASPRMAPVGIATSTKASESRSVNRPRRGHFLAKLISIFRRNR